LKARLRVDRGNMNMKAVQGDITTLTVDAFVNADIHKWKTW